MKTLFKNMNSCPWGLESSRDGSLTLELLTGPIVSHGHTCNLMLAFHGDLKQSKHFSWAVHQSQQRRGTLSETDRSSGQVLSSSIYPWNSGCRSSTPTLALGLSEQGGRVLSVHSSFMEEEEQACFCFRSKPHPPTQH